MRVSEKRGSPFGGGGSLLRGLYSTWGIKSTPLIWIWEMPILVQWRWHVHGRRWAASAMVFASNPLPFGDRRFET